MKNISFRSFTQSRPIWRKAGIPLLVALGVATVLATPPVGFVLNQILAQGTPSADISEHVQIAKNVDGTVDPWQAQIQAQGATDTYVQHLVLAPGGYSGWHSHPGILVATLVGGSVDFYNSNCQKTSYSAGQVYFEAAQPHAIINRGAVNADIYLSYLIKHGQPRRLEADAPGCAATTGIP
jgi:hypothetical protein